MIKNKKHIIFAEEYKLTDNAINSYLKAYPKSNKETARVNSHRLLQKATIASYVQSYKEKIRLERENSQIQAIKSKESSNVLKREKVVEMASNVIKIVYNKITKDFSEQIIDKNLIASFISVSDRYCKLEGLDKPAKTANTTVDGEDAQTISSSDIKDLVNVLRGVSTN